MTGTPRSSTLYFPLQEYQHYLDFMIPGIPHPSTSTSSQTCTFSLSPLTTWLFLGIFNRENYYILWSLSQGHGVYLIPTLSASIPCPTYNSSNLPSTYKPQTIFLFKKYCTESVACLKGPRTPYYIHIFTSDQFVQNQHTQVFCEHKTAHTQ